LLRTGRRLFPDAVGRCLWRREHADNASRKR